MRVVIALAVLLTLMSCGDDVLIKPKAELRLDYDKAVYSPYSNNCAYSFYKNNIALITEKNNCGVNITYPQMKATLYLTYQEVNDSNLDSLLRDAQKLTYDHSIKAESIPEQPFVNPDEDVYGMFYMINGNAATQAQFYATDSLKHFITGALYFEAKPNFDSIYPAVVYLRNDIRRIMETLKWEENK